MHSTKRGNRKNGMIGALVLAGCLLAGIATAGDRSQREDAREDRRLHARQHERRSDARLDRHRTRDHRREARRAAAADALRDARRSDRRLDRRGALIDGHLDLIAFVAAAAGDYELARALDRTGDRIERRFDRRGDRLVWRARQQAQLAPRLQRPSYRHRTGCGHRFGEGRGHRHDQRRDGHRHRRN